MSNSFTHHPSSYRDPSGFIFEKDGILYRQINASFKENFDQFIQGGLYKHLVEKRMLISHEQVNENLTGGKNYYTTIKPERIPFASYAYEWSFDMLKDAAILTLRLAKESVNYGMILKDATPYNIQWHKGKLIFIDTLSFEKFKEESWIAYRQFCESFLGPLLVMHYTKMSLPQLQLAWPDGIPLSIIKSLLPGRSRFSFHTYLHIHLHAKISSLKNNNKASTQHFSKQKLLNLLSSLEILVNKLNIPAGQTTWSAYYDEASQRKDYLEQKKKIVHEWIKEMKDVKTAIDLGANEGEFSKILATNNIETIAADFDSCINRLYSNLKSGDEKNIQPIVLDLSTPTPAIGFNNAERSSFINRTNRDLILALALIHHLAIGKNIPFDMIVDLLQSINLKYLIIEFVPKQDEKIQLMLSTKQDIYTEYDEEHFEQAFKKYYTPIHKQIIEGSGRVLYLFTKK